MKVAELEELLRSEGFEMDASEPIEGPPWYVQAMLGFGAWLAALLLLVAMAMASLLQSDSTRFVVGVLLMLAAAGMVRVERKEFLSQLALALSLAGLGCLMSVPSTTDMHTWLVFQNAILLGAFLACGDARTRFFVTLAWGGVMAFGELLPFEALFLGTCFGLGLLWAHRQHWWLGRWNWLCSPMAYGLAVVVYGYVWRLHVDHNTRTLPMTALLTLLSLWATARVQRRAEMQPGERLAMFAAALLLGMLTWSSPGACVGYTLLLFSFFYTDRILGFMGVAFLLTSGSLHYYDMTWTLMTKSAAMLASGVLLLALARVGSR